MRVYFWQYAGHCCVGYCTWEPAHNLSKGSESDFAVRAWGRTWLVNKNYSVLQSERLKDYKLNYEYECSLKLYYTYESLVTVVFRWFVLGYFKSLK